MYDIFCDVAVIGAGPAGLSAAVAAKKEGAERVLLIERDESIGGILQQCIHPGFGLTYFKEELTGPEYAGRFEDEAKEMGAEVLLNSMVLEVDPREPAVYCVNAQYGMTRVKAGSIVLAMGCREKTRAGIQIPGRRCPETSEPSEHDGRKGDCDSGFRRYRNDHGQENESGGRTRKSSCGDYGLPGRPYQK